MTSGKWYWEVKYASSGTNGSALLGICDTDGVLAGWAGSHNRAVYSTNGRKYSGSSYQDYTSSWESVGNITMYALDMDNGKWWWGLNGNWAMEGDPVNGTAPTHDDLLTASTYSSPNNRWSPYYDDGSNSGYNEQHFNFGQGDPDGDNNFTDSNGRGGFRYEPPSGFLSLCTANMKDADYAPLGPNTAAGTPDKHFDTLLYTGTEKSRRIGGLAFAPDLVWIKNRERSNSQMVYDTLRGAGKDLNSDDATAEATNTNALSGFNADGFSLGTSGTVNYNNENHVAWCWKAGNETTENNDGTLQSTTSVNSDAGFSIVSYKGNATTGATFGHGLSQRPDFVAIKQRTDGTNSNWLCWHQNLSAHNAYLHFDSVAVEATNSAFFTNFGASTITLGNANHTNGDGDQLIAYCWHGVEGYSKFGSYEGNGNADGPFIYLGFKPAFVIIRATEGGNRDWVMHDNKRDPINPLDKSISITTAVENPNYSSPLDFVSNGFKMRSDDTNYNQSGMTHVYMAFAEMPFKYATAR